MARSRDFSAAAAIADASVATRTVEITGGDKLKKKLAEIAHALGNGAELSVGFLSDATYPASADGKAALQVAQVAFWNEYGTSRAPARPFFRNMIAKQSPRWGRALGMNLKNNRNNAKDALTAMGEGIKDQLKESIIETNEPPNAPYTVAKKGFNKPLVDTAHMLRSIDYVVAVK